jgi:hypothetical protein
MSRTTSLSPDLCHCSDDSLMASSARPAILLLVFNRPDCFRRLLAPVRLAKPGSVYVAADGPRDSVKHPDDARLCGETRQLIATIDWPCKVHTLFRDANLGCARAVSTAIDWFFSRETEGIILEDDCLPAPDFFSYSARLLDLYRDDPRVMHINGCNLGAPAGLFGRDLYSFSSLPVVWGWATWRRAWEGYSVALHERDVPPLDVFRRPGISLAHACGIRSTLLKLAQNKFSTWDYQWMMKVIHANGLCATPRENLIQNIGFGTHGTLTTDNDCELARLQHGCLSGPSQEWSHPSLRHDVGINRYLSTKSFGSSRTLTWRMLKNWVRRREF